MTKIDDDDLANMDPKKARRILKNREVRGAGGLWCGGVGWELGTGGVGWELGMRGCGVGARDRR